MGCYDVLDQPFASFVKADETLVCNYQITQRHINEDSYFTARREVACSNATQAAHESEHIQHSNWEACLEEIFASFTEGVMQIRREIVLGGAGPPDTKANRKLRNIIVPKGTVLKPIVTNRGSNSERTLVPRAFRKDKRHEGSWPAGSTRLITFIDMYMS
jgi:hypothetical protein